jgi:PAS domain S-box-containing protein
VRRFNFQPSLGVIAALATSVLVATIVVNSVASMESSWRTPSVVASLAIAALLTVVLGRELSRRARADRTLFRAAVALNELSGFDELTGDEQSVPEMLDDLTRRVQSVLNARWAAVWLAEPGSDTLSVAATSGDAPWVLGEQLDTGSAPHPSSPERFDVPLTLGGEQLGLLEVGARSGADPRRGDHEVLRLMGDRVAAAIERLRLADAERRSRLGASQARAHLGLIAAVSSVLARALEDTRPALREVVDIIVRDFADACAIHLALPDSGLERVGAGGRYPRAEDMTDELIGSADAISAHRRVMASGASELSFVTAEGHVYGVTDELTARMQAAGMRSWVMAPIRLRGLAYGTITVATGQSRRGFRPSDQAVVDELADRIAVVVERGVLYRETRIAGVGAEQRAAQLSNLIEAAIAFNRSLQPEDLLQALVQQASRLLDASYCRAWLEDGTGIEATEGKRARATVKADSALVGPAGTPIGYLSVEREQSRPFSGDDETLLLLLARFASVALRNAGLYEDVRLREQRLEALVAASPLAILELDLEGSIEATNPAARAMFGGGPNEDIELPEALAERLGELSARAIEGRVSEGEVSTVTERGQLDLLVSTAPLLRGSGVRVGVLAVITDMTVRKRLEEQLIEANRYEAIAQLAGGIAHDFNNLLTIIVGYSDLLLQTMTASSTQFAELTAIHEAGRHAAVITNQLLTMSRGQVVQPVVVNLASASESLQPMLQRLVGDRMAIETRGKGAAAISIDPGQLEQVLFNLVINSRDASPEGAAITITTKAVTGRKGEKEVALVVQDTGEGMDAETVARCREPFFTTKGRRGIGLGLATVTSIVQRAGGRLEIDSRPGRGTTISAIFPRAAPVSAAAPPKRRRKQARVLLVDDDELIQRYASQVLLDAGYDVTAVGDAEAAVVALTEGRFDLLVSDVVLPGMSGFQLAARVGEQWPRVARLLITGYAGTDTHGTDLADVTVLPKPFAGDDLVRAAGDVLAEMG